MFAAAAVIIALWLRGGAGGDCLGFPFREDHSEAGQHLWNALLFSGTVSSEIVVLSLGLRQIVDSGLLGTFWLWSKAAQ